MSEYLSWNFRFDSPISTRLLDQRAFVRKVLARFCSTALPAAPGGAGFASRGTRNPQKCSLRSFQFRFRPTSAGRPGATKLLAAKGRRPTAGRAKGRKRGAGTGKAGRGLTITRLGVDKWLSNTIKSAE